MSKRIPIEHHPPAFGWESEREDPTLRHAQGWPEEDRGAMFGIALAIGLGAILWLGGGAVLYLFWKLF